MATDKNAASIGLRFLEEQDYIAGYVRFLVNKSSIHDQQIRQINTVLTRFGLELLPKRPKRRSSDPFNSAEIGALLPAISRTSLIVEEMARAFQEDLPSQEQLELHGPAAEYPDLLREWVDYLAEGLSENPSQEEIDNAVDLTTNHPLFDNYEIPSNVRHALIQEAGKRVSYLRIFRQVDSLKYVLDQFEQLQLQARVSRPDAEINVLRQGFLLLMTAFDAAVFDIVRVIIHQDFFNLIGEFGKIEKATYADLKEWGSFDRFREAAIQEQLKTYYLKDLFRQLNRLGIRCVDEAAGAKFVEVNDHGQRPWL